MITLLLLNFKDLEIQKSNLCCAFHLKFQEVCCSNSFHNCCCLWPPCVADADILFLSSFFLLLSFFFPRIISVVANWMSTILLRMVWPYCEFRMQVWNVLHTACWKCRMQKSLKICHLGTIAQLCWAISLQLRHVSTIGKKIVKQQYLPHMSLQYGELTDR